LAEIIEQQRRQYDGKPAEPDRQAPEMPHIGVHRLAPGDDEEHRAKHRERDAWRRLNQVNEGAMGADCL
jgi:hypothetical protein